MLRFYRGVLLYRPAHCRSAVCHSTAPVTAGTDESVGDSPDERDDLVEPVHYWECGSGGFPPSGAAFYDGDSIPEWRGDLFAGNLAGQYLGRFAVDGRDVAEREPLLADREWRIRAIETAPDTGHLYVAIDGDPAPIVRLVPD
jgi:glucose/arabinose dehydrogenase